MKSRNLYVKYLNYFTITDVEVISTSKHSTLKTRIYYFLRNVSSFLTYKN